MINIYALPTWFVGFDEYLELLFALVSLLVTIFALRIYQLTEGRQVKLFTVSFMLISISYFIQSFFNSGALSYLINNNYLLISEASILTVVFLGIYSYFLFFLMGLITFTYMTLDRRSIRLYSLISLSAVLSLVFSLNRILLFYAMSSLFLVYIAVNYIKQLYKSGQPRIITPLAAFFLLLVANLGFMLSSNTGRFYIAGHFLELGAFSLLLVNMLVVLRRWTVNGASCS